MKQVAFTEFRKRASALFSDVEQGEVLLVTRHGKPIAEVSRVTSAQDALPSWKRPGPRLSVQGAGLGAAILEERSHADLL